MCRNFFSLSIIQCEEKCRSVQERLELAEQKLAFFSQKQKAAAEKSFCKVISRVVIHFLIGARILFLSGYEHFNAYKAYLYEYFRNENIS